LTRGRRRLRAIDLYSGVGGWSLGLRLADIDVIASYERWGPANETNFKNNRHLAQTVDIRRLSLDELPKNVDVVVGSPPCTEFSYANHGGQGAISNGLVDIVRFLTIVEHLRPRFWVMENVPRARDFIERELQRGGRLRKFARLGVRATTVNMAEFGLPQRRIRSLVGNINFDLLARYSARHSQQTLGSVVSALRGSTIRDPLYGVELDQQQLTDHVFERGLNQEEMRINRAAKQFHPIYNSMAYPDSLDRPSRTVTATCTRVSRESIVIQSPEEDGSYRRLTIRERALLQGFPITYQFYGTSYSRKSAMVGNAIPPFFSFQIAHAIRGTRPEKVPVLAQVFGKPRIPQPAAKSSQPDKEGKAFRADRRFRFAIPSLRLGSGVRFELTNEFQDGQVSWNVAFYFGTSREIHTIMLNVQLLKLLRKLISKSLYRLVNLELGRSEKYIRDADIARMQTVWSHRGLGGTSPLMLLDQLDESGGRIGALLLQDSPCAERIVDAALKGAFGSASTRLSGFAKLVRNAPIIASGMLLGASANSILIQRRHPLEASGKIREKQLAY
jgi:DNA (cytosine-5)-methyltransferase 1